MSALVGAAVGLLGGVGAVTSLARVPALRRPSLADRMAPHLRDQARPSTLLDRRRGGPAPIVADLGLRLGRLPRATRPYAVDSSPSAAT